MEARGFVVAAWEESRERGSSHMGRPSRVFLTGRLEGGESFAAILPAPGPAVYVREAEAASARAALAGAGLAAEEDEKAWTDLGGAPLVRFALGHGGLGRAERALDSAGIAAAARERPRADEALAMRGIRGPLLLRGEARPGRRVDLVFVEPELEAAEADPALRWLALDIETDRDEGVVAVSLAEPDEPGEVLFLDPGLGPVGGGAPVEVFGDERSLLAALASKIAHRDPDVVTGWNVLDFDLRVLAKRYAAHGLAFDCGRTEAAAGFVELSGRRSFFDLPGRAVLDGLRLVRASGADRDDLSLEAVARRVLGEGKSVASRGEAKIEELERLRAADPAAFCAYCLRDSRLVLRILAETGLDRLTSRRAALTGVSLDLAWTSIPAFERIYGVELRARRVLPPEREERRVSGAAGGTVLDPAPGIFPNVLVFDYRSLYPSIMRTFNIDPLAHARAPGIGGTESRSAAMAAPVPGPAPNQARSDDSAPRSAAIAPRDQVRASIAFRSTVMGSRSEPITAPNGARFSREPGILPDIIARYAERRERALEDGDEVAAYVYKILQNSFYGVLGAEGCRYARTELAGAITSFGRKYLLAARDYFEARGMRVLYGDTDSVFALSGLGDGASRAELMALGTAAAAELNARIAASIEAEYGLRSMLRIRCEKAYRRFFIPRLRGPAAGYAQAIARRGEPEEGPGEDGAAEGPEGAERGRAKGYAGLRLDEDGEAEVEVKGMEAARSDFTPLARRFQVELLGLAFSGAGRDELRDFCRAAARGLRGGALDGELVYRRSLRRPAEEYGSETPQVRAARLLGWTRRRGRISYVMTLAGAEPAEARSGSPLDYEHYVERQLLPIARSVSEALGLGAEEAEAWFADRPQLELGLE